MGTGLGTLIAPPLIVFLSVKFGWRTAFLVAGVAGVVWVPFWLVATRPKPGNAVQPGTRTREAVPRNLSVLAYAIARFFGDSSGYFVMFWMPEYLVSSKNFSFVMLGTLGWIPPCGSDIGAIAGGYFSSRLVARGLPPILSRKILMTVASALLAVGACMLTTTSTFMVLFSLTVCTIGVGMWASNLHALATDAFPPASVSTVHGTAGSAGAIGGVLFNSLVGYFRTRHQDGPVLLMLGLILPVSILALWLLMKNTRKDDSHV